MAVSERQRQEYLRELGIQSYFPRRALPGAKPSPRYATGTLVATESQRQSAETSVEMISALIGTPPAVHAGKVVMSAPPFASKLAPAESLLQEFKITPPVPRASVAGAVTAPVPDSEARVEEARFAFAYFPINEDLAVINELPWAKAAAVSPTCRQLLAAILKALSVSCEEKTLTSMVFTWPLDDSPQTDRSAQSARHMLDGFMARRLKLRPVRYLLILAEQSAGYLFPTGFDWQQAGMRRHPHHAMDVVVTHSLNAMEAVPDIKRSVWQALQPLRAALTKPASNADDTATNGQ
ncbi:MAG: hypothetical protein Q8L60_08025 [Gammaproteobacteria bacterium]|nr:hypothetical protein [Gammaproteobacteria bacterium]MDP2140086.1 hypothetical protein [Gammaproteobacteria bacterium]MDP2347648.1 hypothetical protein [Gammaproteobacteria bacterium]